MKSKVWYLKQFPLFEGLSDKKIKGIARFLDEKQVGRMEIVFDPEDEDKVFFVKRGMVEVYHISEDGKKTILETLGPKSFFAAVGFSGGGSHFLEATENTLLCVTTKNRLFEMVLSEQGLTRSVVEGLLRQLFETRERVAVLASGSVKDRLLHILGKLARQYGVKTSGRLKIDSRFTHEDLANMIGASRETVTKMLAVLEDEGVVGRQGKYLIIDIEGISKEL